MPVVDPDAAYQTVITTFEVNPGTCADLIDKLSTAYADFIRRQPGFVSAAIHVNDAQTRIANYSQWVKREDFLAMLRSDEMRAHTREFTKLCRSFEPVLYDVVEVSRSP